jgi:hypothetical protein
MRPTLSPVRALERAIERDLTPDEIATIKSWLVATAQRLDQATESRAAPDQLASF